MILFLKKSLEQLNAFVANFVGMFLSLVKIAILSKVKVRIPKAAEKEIVLMGNGPSFRKALDEHPDFFQHKELCCVNFFPNTEEYEKLKPSSIIWLDHIYYPHKTLPLKEEVKTVVESIINKTTWKVTLFVPYIAKSAQHIEQIPLKNANVTLCYFNYTIITGFEWFRRLIYRSNWGMPLCQNVVVAATFLAVNKGYSNVYLTGVENGFFKELIVGEDNQIYLGHTHFYSPGGEKIITRLHKDTLGQEETDLADALMLAVKTFRGYKEVRRYADYRKVSVYNLTEGSYVDAFVRKKIASLT
jgi:hypothetical protein